jgi:hypothetical protein
MEFIKNNAWIICNVLMLFVAVAGLWMCFKSKTAMQEYDDALAAREHDPGPIDPWAHQRDLMSISGQDLPAWPELNKTAVLYLALNLEEQAETMAAVAKLYRQAADNNEPWGTEEQAATLARGDVYTNTAALLSSASASASTHSRTIRACLAGWKDDDLFVSMSLEDAVAVFDGTTDVQVTNSGFAEACGLPGAEGYVEVVGSNISKRNPDTGLIDKLPDGKWIKGPDYVEPDLLKVLKDAYVR